MKPDIANLPTGDSEAEQMVIGSVLLLPNVLDDIALILSPEDFLAMDLRTLYRHLQKLHESGKRVDTKLLLESLRRSNDLGSPDDRVKGLKPTALTIADCATSVATAANAKYYANMVRDRAVRRAIHEAGVKILDVAKDIQDGQEAINQTESIAFAVRDTHRVGVERIYDASELLESAVKQIDDALHGKGKVFWETGFGDVDKLAVLHPQQLVIIAARPSMGKTAWGLNVAVNVAASHSVLFVSLEMSAQQLAMRLLSSASGVELHVLARGSLTPAQRSRIIQTQANLSALKFAVDDSPSRNVTEIAAVARRHKRRYGLSVLMVDYLQLITAEDQKMPREQQVASMSKRLKGIARELDICVVCLAQLNRQNEGKEDKRPTLSHLRESGAIEQDADIVAFIHRDEYYTNSKEDAEKLGITGKAEIIIRKQRNGSIGTADVLWQPQFTRFVNVVNHIQDHANYNGEFEEYAQ